MRKIVWSFYSGIFLFSSPALAEGQFTMGGSSLSFWWGVPFVLVLGSLALFPLVLPKIWHPHYGKILGLYTSGILVPLFLIKGWQTTIVAVTEIIAHHYLPFLCLIAALYITAGGIQITIQGSVSAKLNTLILAIATFVAGWIGTTGAAMLFIRPFLLFNKDRLHRQHLVIFFIFLVCNIGGALTPLGDPPLFLGYLEGVDFFWPLKNLALPLLFLALPLLGIFYLWDHRLQDPSFTPNKGSPFQIRIQGYENIAYLGGVVSLILMTGLWKPETSFSFSGISWELQNLVRDTGLLLLALLSYFKTSPLPRQANDFSWAPLQEVAIIFAAIFITAAPVLDMLKAGEQSPFYEWLRLINQADGAPSPSLYFWATGFLSSLLDNAPTYLIFFNMAGGDPQLLMTTLQPVLFAISAGSVFMGALTYIGNAPNFMVKSIAESYHIRMPGFFGYSGRALLLLLPILGLMIILFLN